MQKVDEVYDLLSYDINYKFDIQYTPFLEIGNNVIFPTSVLACSNLMRNTIAYSYLSKNEIVNEDGGKEPVLIKIMQDSMDKYYNKISYGGKSVLYESFIWNMKKLYELCDEKLKIIEKIKKNGTNLLKHTNNFSPFHFL